MAHLDQTRHTAAHIRLGTWPGTPRWEWTMWRLGEDEHGAWLWAPPGTDTGDGDPTGSAGAMIGLLPHDDWWFARWNADVSVHGPDVDLSVGVVVPPVWEGDAATIVGLDLSVVRRHDGGIEVVGEDIFETHRRTLRYPEHIVDKARTTTAAVYLAVAAGEEPFAEIGAAWIDAARSLARP